MGCRSNGSSELWSFGIKTRTRSPLSANRTAPTIFRCENNPAKTVKSSSRNCGQNMKNKLKGSPPTTSSVPAPAFCPYK